MFPHVFIRQICVVLVGQFTKSNIYGQIYSYEKMFIVVIPTCNRSILQLGRSRHYDSLVPKRVFMLKQVLKLVIPTLKRGIDCSSCSVHLRHPSYANRELHHYLTLPHQPASNTMSNHYHATNTMSNHHHASHRHVIHFMLVKPSKTISSPHA